MIDEIFNNLNIIGRNRAKIESLGEIETNDVIGIFIRSTLPRFMWFGKIDQRIELLFNFVKIGKLRTIVQTDAPERKSIEHCDDCGSCFVGIPA